MKRSFSTVLLAWVLAFAMILPSVPVLSVPVFASSAQNKAVVEEDGTITLPNVNNGKPVVDTGFRVGWGQGDITPSYETETMPCAFGSGQTTVYDEVWDHLYATCVIIHDGENTAIMFSVDLKGISDDNEGYAGAAYDVKVLTNAKAAAAAAAADLGYSVPTGSITFSATHNHNAPCFYSTGSGGKNVEVFERMNRWRQLFYDAISEAVTEALTDLAPAEVYQGSAIAPNVNSVRRYYLADGTYDGTHTSIDTYDIKENPYLAHESVADPEIQTLHFRREHKKDILMLNWQAHAASANNESSSAFTSDYVHYLREEIEGKLGVHLIYLNGANGNTVVGDNVRNESGKNSWRLVGKRLLPYVVEALETEVPVTTGEVRVVNDTYKATYRDDSALPGWNPDEGRCYTEEEIAADIAATLKKGKFSKSNYPTTTRWGQACYIRYTHGSQSVANNSGDLEKYQFQSWFEAFRMVSRASSNGWYNEGYTVKKVNVPFVAISCGDMAFAFSSYEMFDTNGQEVKEGSPFAITFMVSLTDGSNGYIPSQIAWDRENYHARLNRLAVEADQEPLYLFATGGAGYEVNSTAYIPGTGEAMAQKLVQMLDSIADGETVMTVGSEGDYATVADALAAAKEMTWKTSQSLKIQVLESGELLLHTGGIYFNVGTIFRENGAKLAIAIEGATDGIVLTPTRTSSEYITTSFTNDYTFRNLTLDIAAQSFYVYAGSGEVRFENVSFGSGGKARFYADAKNLGVFNSWTEENLIMESVDGLINTSFAFRDTTYNTPASAGWQGAYIAACGGNTDASVQIGSQTVDMSKIHSTIYVEDGADLTRVNGYLSLPAPQEVGKASIVMTGGQVKGLFADGGNSVSFTAAHGSDYYQNHERNPNVEIVVMGGNVLGTGDGVAISGVTNAKYGKDANIQITLIGGVIYDKVVAVGGHAKNTGNSDSWFDGSLESIDGKITIDYYGGILQVPDHPDFVKAVSSPIYGVYVQNKYNCHTVKGEIRINTHINMLTDVSGMHSDLPVTPSYTGEGIPEAGLGAVLASTGKIHLSHQAGNFAGLLTGTSGDNIIEGELKISFDGGDLGIIDKASTEHYGKVPGYVYGLYENVTVKNGGKVILEVNEGSTIFGNFRIGAEEGGYTVQSGGLAEVRFNSGRTLSSSSTSSTETNAAKNDNGSVLKGAGQTVDSGFQEGSTLRIKLYETLFSSKYIASFYFLHSVLLNCDVEIEVFNLNTKTLSRRLQLLTNVTINGDYRLTIDMTEDGTGPSSKNAEGKSFYIGAVHHVQSNVYGTSEFLVDGGEDKAVTIGQFRGVGATNAIHCIKNAYIGDFGIASSAIMKATDSAVGVQSITNELENVDLIPMDITATTTTLLYGTFIGAGNSTNAVKVYGTVRNIFENVTAEGTVVGGAPYYSNTASTADSIENYFGKTKNSVNHFYADVVAGHTAGANTVNTLTNHFAGTNTFDAYFYGTNKGGGTISGNVIHNLGGTPIFTGSGKGFYDNVNDCTVSGNLTTNLTGTIVANSYIKLGISNSVSSSVTVNIDGANIEDGVTAATLQITSKSGISLLAGNTTVNFKNGVLKGTLNPTAKAFKIYSGDFYAAPQGTYTLEGGTIIWNADETHTLTPSKVNGATTITRTASPYIEGAVMVQVTSSTYQNRLTLDNSNQSGGAQKRISGSTYQIVGIAGQAISPIASLILTERIYVKIRVSRSEVETAAEIEGVTEPSWSFSAEGMEAVSGTFADWKVDGEDYIIKLPAMGAGDFRTALHFNTNFDQNFEFSLEWIANTGAALYTGTEQQLFEALVDYGAAACGDETLTYFDASAIKTYDIPSNFGGTRGEGRVHFTHKTLLMGDAVGLRLIADSGDLTGIRVVLNDNMDITSRCVIDEENKVVDFFVNSKHLNETFTVSVYDAEGKLCVSMTECVKRIAAKLLASEPDNVKAQAMMYYIQSIQDYLLDFDPMVKPSLPAPEAGDVIPL